MQLAIALAIVASVLIPHDGYELESETLGIRLIFSLVAFAAPALFAWRYKRTLCIASDPEDFVRSLLRFERLFLLVWALAIAVALGIFRWNVMVLDLPGIANSALLSRFTVVLPILAPLIVYWWIVATAEGEHLASKNSNIASPNWRENTAVLWIQIRQMMLLPVTPVFAILLLDDLLNWLPAVGEYRVLLFGGLVATLPFLLPIILRQLWNLESLSHGEKREQIQSHTFQVQW